MNAYRFDPDTKIFTGILRADPDPCNKDSWLLPGHSTFTPINQMRQGYLQKWTGSQWEYIEDRVYAEFKAACAQFRQICAQIGEVIDRPDFKGGFDEMALFAQSPVYHTVEGLQLAMSWSAANELCKYTGMKAGYGQPQWWYKCWQQSDSQEGIE